MLIPADYKKIRYALQTENIDEKIQRLTLLSEWYRGIVDSSYWLNLEPEYKEHIRYVIRLIAHMIELCEAGINIMEVTAC